MSGIPLKKPKVLTDDSVDLSKCIICQKTTEEKTASTENGRKSMRNAADLRRDEVYNRLQCLKEEDVFVYHVNNVCYKKYTLKKTLDTLSRGENWESMKNESQEKRKTRSLTTHRAAPNDDTVIYKKKCVICNFIKHNGVYQKYRICEHASAEKFLEATIHFQDDVYERTCDLQDVGSVFGSDIFYHGNCLRGYIVKYERAQTIGNINENHTIKETAFKNLLQEINCDLQKGVGFPLSDLRDRLNVHIKPAESKVNNREMKLFLINEFQGNICFSNPTSANKS